MLPPTRSRVLVIFAMAVWLGLCVALFVFDWPGRYTRQIPPPRSLTSILIFIVCSTAAFVLIVLFTTRWFKHNRQFTPVQTRRIVEVGLAVGVLAIIITGVRSYMVLWK